MHDGDERSPAADPRRMPARPETPRPTIAARNDLPGGDGDQSTDEGEDHDEDSLPQPDWTPPPATKWKARGRGRTTCTHQASRRQAVQSPATTIIARGAGRTMTASPRKKKKSVPLLGRGHLRGPDPHPPSPPLCNK